MRALHRKSNAAVTSRTHTLGRLWYNEVGDTVDLREVWQPLT